MLDKKMVTIINEQINKELYSAYLYLDFANYFADAGLNGFANWYTIQCKEEQEHAEKFITYLQDNNQQVKLAAIDAPKADYKDYGSVLEQALKHEEFVTDSINKIYELALKLKDYRTQSFLTWYIDEQLEEEKNANDLIAEFALYKDSNLAELDKKLGERTA